MGRTTAGALVTLKPPGAGRRRCLLRPLQALSGHPPQGPGVRTAIHPLPPARSPRLGHHLDRRASAPPKPPHGTNAARPGQAHPVPDGTTHGDSNATATGRAGPIRRHRGDPEGPPLPHRCGSSKKNRAPLKPPGARTPSDRRGRSPPALPRGLIPPASPPHGTPRAPPHVRQLTQRGANSPNEAPPSIPARLAPQAGGSRRRLRPSVDLPEPQGAGQGRLPSERHRSGERGRAAPAPTGRRPTARRVIQPTGRRHTAPPGRGPQRWMMTSAPRGRISNSAFTSSLRIRMQPRLTSPPTPLGSEVPWMP